MAKKEPLTDEQKAQKKEDYERMMAQEKADRQAGYGFRTSSSIQNSGSPKKNDGTTWEQQVSDFSGFTNEELGLKEISKETLKIVSDQLLLDFNAVETLWREAYKRKSHVISSILDDKAKEATKRAYMTEISSSTPDITSEDLFIEPWDLRKNRVHHNPELKKSVYLAILEVLISVEHEFGLSYMYFLNENPDTFAWLGSSVYGDGLNEKLVNFATYFTGLTDLNEISLQFERLKAYLESIYNLFEYQEPFNDVYINIFVRYQISLTSICGALRETIKFAGREG